jgi:isopentenyl diphosphate isomerase/L-lactate dehydrogenase-like FMN-dependent dehydrogenase
MTLEEAASIDDLAELARRRIPRFAFDFLDGGAGGEIGLRRNRAALEAIALMPRYCTGVTPRTGMRLLDRDYALPFGLAPIGLGNLVWPQADATLATLAAEAGMPVVVSSAATTSIEEMARAAPGAWFQIYVARNAEISRDLMRRAQSAGVEVLVVTIDIPVPGKRNRDLRNRLTLPFRPGLGTLLDLVSSPSWSLAMLRHGSPTFVNYAPYSTGDARAQSLAQFMGEQIKGDLTWDDLRAIRELWPGKMIVKGVLAAEDARLALALGADALWVSNHGGRQLDSAPAPCDALPGIRAAVGASCPLIMDGGVRSGEDIVKARLRGDDFVMTGRALYYGVAAGGRAGGARAIALLADELRRALGQIGCPSFAELDARWESRAASV